MTSRRVAKVSQAIRELVSTAILFELKDPRVKNVTVIDAEVSADLRTAKVYVSVMGDEKAESLSMHGLNSTRGFLQSKIAERLQIRYTPVLQFILDRGIKKSIEASRIIREALEESSDSAASDVPVVGDEDHEKDHRPAPLDNEEGAASQAAPKIGEETG